MGCNRPSTLIHTVELLIFNYYFVELNPVIFPCVEQIYSKDLKMGWKWNWSRRQSRTRGTPSTCVSISPQNWWEPGFILVLRPVFGHVLCRVPSTPVWFSLGLRARPRAVPRGTECSLYLANRTIWAFWSWQCLQMCCCVQLMSTGHILSSLGAPQEVQPQPQSSQGLFSLWVTNTPGEAPAATSASPPGGKGTTGSWGAPVLIPCHPE